MLIIQNWDVANVAINQGEVSSFNRLLHSHRLSRCRTSWASSCGLSVAPSFKIDDRIRSYDSI